MAYPLRKTYRTAPFTIEPGMGRAYAEATDDPHPAYRGTLVPPMFHVRPFIGLMMQCATDPELGIDLLRLVHGEHVMDFLRPLHEGDVLHPRGALEAVEEKRSGRLYTFALWGEVAGQRVLEGRTTYFVRSPEPRPRPARRSAPSDEPPPSWSIEQAVTQDQAERYAAASGDHNPIHLDPEVARRAGLPGVILHGLCTLAFAQRDLIARYCPDDPGRLVSLGARFAAPVFPGDTLRMDVWEENDGLRFRTVDGAGKVVLAAGRARMRGS